MRLPLSSLINAPKTLRAAWRGASRFRLNTTPVLMCTSSLQGDGVCNGKPRRSDPQLFEAQFDELVTELAEKDLADPALADALSRFREAREPRVFDRANFWQRLDHLFLAVTTCRLPPSGVGVQLPRRQEEPRTVRDRFAEGPRDPR